MENQNGQETLNAIGTAVAIVILAVIAALVVGSILDSSVFSSGLIDGTNTNESLGVVNATVNVTFDIISSQPAANCSLGAVYNSTGGELLLASNYTFYSDCNLILQGGSPYIGEELNATYDFTYQASGSTIIDINNVKTLFGEFITGLLGFLGIIGIVLGVIWLIRYVTKLFRKGGLNDLGATA